MTQVSASNFSLFPAMSLPSKPISLGDIVDLIEKLPARKAPRHNLINYKVLKNVSKKYIFSSSTQYYSYFIFSPKKSSYRSTSFLQINLKKCKPAHL